MREIKFRVWMKENKDEGFGGEWSYFKFPDDLEGENYHDSILYDWKTFAQFTGLIDKNGKDIYEGDILTEIMEPTCLFTNGPTTKITYSFEMDTSLERQIIKRESIGDWNVWYDKGFADKSSLELTEVIGNIFENPELLKK